MKAAVVLGFVALVTSVASTQAAEREQALIMDLRDDARRFDAVARTQASSMEMAEARERFAAHLRDAAHLKLKNDEFLKFAEIFVLSGGGVEHIKPWKDDQPGEMERNLIRGIVAHGSGDTTRAEAILLAIDARSLDAVRGGHLALVQALLAARTDAQRAFSYYGLARLLLPGTLVEEAALRQSIVLAGEKLRAQEFAEAALAYIRRFDTSTFAGDAETRIVSYLPRFEDADGAAILERMLEARPMGFGRCPVCFLTEVAQRGVLSGRRSLVLLATGKGLALVENDAPQKQRLLLYQAAVEIVTDKYEGASDTLKSLNPESFDADDAALLSASLQLARKLRETPKPLSDEVALAGNRGGNRVFLGEKRVMEARAAVANADLVLQRER
ncbi:hypothetical protein Rvan_2568 [Rhodomicrobium vannielii ATCC 17100]|uniref:Chemotaxis protein n=1 Tax=Rhodomicrobium vannielii (strain ATCC 17100 / DSM 162 / LMG 4299 / NCIMB 10020 / ATH 3.1.1) TaxID=648757 RepID=E3I6R5_RHOVT|nr:hypothetical protein [Rhodomicrobium vannielii]ADP71783.1 hypothetical protein Rvan_2568 [Rhodomicrobium vannielii ATCC 17100]